MAIFNSYVSLPEGIYIIIYINIPAYPSLYLILAGGFKPQVKGDSTLQNAGQTPNMNPSHIMSHYPLVI